MGSVLLPPAEVPFPLRTAIPGFELLELLGAGHSGRVFRARREGTGEILAVKVSHPSQRHSHEDVAFKLEYSLHANLRHPGVVRAHQFGDCGDGCRFYTMDFVPSTPLREVFRRGGLPSLGEVALRVCEALEYAHAQGILHADLKPANILVSMTEAGQVAAVRIGDFGLAQLMQNPSRRSVHGSLAYLAPEQLLRWKIDARSDIYSLGVTLVESITGVAPVGPAEPNGTPGSREGAKAHSILDAFPDLEPGWATLLDSMTSRAPGARPVSATDVIDRLRTLLGRRDDRRADLPALTVASIGPPLRLVGRVRVLESLAVALRDLDGPRGLLLYGEEGVGKTRIAEEFVQAIELDDGRVLRSDAADALASASGGAVRPGTAMDPHRARTVAFEQAASSLFGDPQDDERGTVLLFDSLEQADAETFDWVAFMAARLRGTRSFVIAILREQEGSDARARLRGLDFAELHVSALSRDEIRELLVSTLDDSGRGGDLTLHALDDETADDLTDWMFEHGGGNPRRILAALQELVRRGMLVREQHAWLLDRELLKNGGSDLAPLLSTPHSFESMNSDQREILEVAAVLGLEFDARDLALHARASDEQLDGFLAHALGSGLLRHGQSGVASYRFTSPARVRDVLESIAPDRRAQLHRRRADELESNGAEESDPALLAHHFEHAGDIERAARLSIVSATRSRGRRAYPAAIRDYERAWRLLSHEARSLIPEFASDWVHSLHVIGRYAESAGLAADLLNESTPIAPASARGARLKILRGMGLASLGDWGPATELLSSLQRGEPKLDDPRLEAWALLELARVLMTENQRDEAHATLLRSRELAASAGDPRVAGLAEIRLGLLAWRQNDVSVAIEWHARARDHLSHPDGEDLLPTVWGHLAVCHLARLELRETIRMHRRSAEGFAKQFRRAEAARAYQNLATALLEIGSWNDAESALKMADVWSRSSRGPRELSHFFWGRARLALGRGLLSEAVNHAARSVEHARAHGDPIIEVGATTLSALVDLSRGERERASATAQAALEMSRACAYPWGIAKSLYLLGLAAPEGSSERDDRLAEAAEHAGRGEIFSLLFRIDLARAELRAIQGRREEIDPILARCRDLQEKSESTLWEGALRKTEGCVALSTHQITTACDALTRAHEIYSQLGAEQHRAEVLAHLARAWHLIGNRNAAQAAWKQSRTIREQLGLPPIDSAIPVELESGSSLSTVRRVLEVAASVSRSVTRVGSVARVLESILDAAITHLGAERGVIALADSESKSLVVRFARNMDRESIPDCLDISWSAIERIGKGEGVLATGDALADPALGLHESIRRFRIRSLVAVPIRRSEELLGVLYMDHRELVDLFGEEQRLFLEFIAEMAAIGIQNAQRWELARDEARSLRNELTDSEPTVPGILGTSHALRQATAQLRRAAQGGRIVLLRGPTGSGKDLFARALHTLSGRRGSFVNCPLPSMQETLFASELFGVVRGTATGVEGRRGLVEEAQGGTLFLNEIGDVPLSMQQSLLHLLGEREYRPVGATGSMRTSDALIVCATNADLERRVEEGTFREDLYYRVREQVIDVPPLRDRPEDIPLLVEHVLREEAGGNVVLTPEAIERLSRCVWKGNVRELISCVRAAVSNAKGDIVEASDLQSPSLPPVDAGGPAHAGDDVEAQVQLLELRLIRDALIAEGGVITRAGARLGIPEATLRRKIRKARLEHLVLHRKPRRGRESDTT